MVNRKIFVIGFGLYGSIHGAAEYNVRIEVSSADLVVLAEWLGWRYPTTVGEQR